MDFGVFFTIMLGAAIVNNFVLYRFLGLCPLIGVTKDVKNAAAMSLAVIFVMLMGTAATWPIHVFLLEPNDLGFLQIVAFIIVIGSLVQFVEIALKRYNPPLHKSFGIYLPLLTTNCAIIAVTLLNIAEGFTFFESLVHALGAGLGFMLAMLLFSGIRRCTESAEPPASFKGIPLAFVSAAILSLAFFGFAGVVENIFGQS